MHGGHVFSSIPASQLSILRPDSSAQPPLYRERISPMGNAAVTGGSGLAVHRQSCHSHSSHLLYTYILSTRLTSQMDLTDPQHFSTQLEPYPSRGHQYQHYEAEQTFNDVFHGPTTSGGRGESQTTQEPEAGSHRGKGKRTPPGPFS